MKNNNILAKSDTYTSEYCCTVVRIGIVNPIEGKDRIGYTMVNGETIVSTYDHPYYVKGKYFVNACDLWIGAELVNNNEMVRLVEQLYREALGESSVEVFNFIPVDRICDDYKFEIGFSVFICKKLEMVLHCLFQII